MAAHKIWRKAFLATLAQCGNVREACEAAGIQPMSAYRNRRSDSEFASEWDDALNEAADILEKEAWRRACEGVEEPVFYKGEVCGRARKYSDLLLMFMLKGIRPEKYRERVYVSPAELDKLIEQQLKILKGEEEPESESEALVN